MQVPASDIINILITATVFLVLLAGFIVLLVNLFAKAQKNFALEKENINREHETQLLQAQLEIQEQTLEHISQEIHDNIGQVLSFVKISIKTVNPARPEETTAKLSEADNLIAKAIQDLRSLSKTLNPGYVHDIGLTAGIKHQLNFLERTGAFKIQFNSTGSQHTYSKKTEIILFRIVQELLNNTVKHSQATSIEVSIDYQPNQLLITVSDNGKGFDPDLAIAGANGLGLKNMKNRLTMIQGNMKINSRPEKGTSVVISIARDEKNSRQ
jgi:two-component system, NarL family, sensor kinase